ncbi:TRAP transporter small permease [Anaerotruncus colihominis]|uniref:TRAP transporter small permease n=1 Tax=Anaerotruncus colihominis TaxID=169435 RepID=UPI0035126EB7
MQQNKKSFIKTLDGCLDKVEITIGIIAFLGMTFTVLISVILRYVVRVPNLVGEEISRYFLVTVVFIGISVCMRVKGHMGVTIFVDHLPFRIRAVVRCFADLVSTVTILGISYFAWKYAFAAVKHPQISVATGLPMYVMYAVMAFGFTLSAIHLLILFWNDYLSKTHPLSEKEGGNG